MPPKSLITIVVLFTVLTSSQFTYGQNEDKPIADLNEAIRLDSQNALAYNNRGNAWSDKGDYDKAIADYNEAIRLNLAGGSATVL